ncbi:MAG: type III restriction endonuclease subunit R [Lachnospiraceae bacterium]|nr:type III restriction endonuclease subunit R [Lachnospiraceae bacterium]
MGMRFPSACTLYRNKRNIKTVPGCLKEDGVFYSSFKYGRCMRTNKGRTFYDYDEIGLQNLAVKNRFCVEEIFITQDVRENRESEQWINLLGRKGK